MPLVPVGFNIAHVLFVCRQLAPETGTGYWYQKTGQCVWPFTRWRRRARYNFTEDKYLWPLGLAVSVNEVAA